MCVRVFIDFCASTRRLFPAVDAKYGKVFVKHERDRERAEAELSALVRLRYVAHSHCLVGYLLCRGVPGVATLLHTEFNYGARMFVFPLLEPWMLEMHAQSLERVNMFCRQLFEVRVIFVCLVSFLQSGSYRHLHLCMSTASLIGTFTLATSSTTPRQTTDFGLSGFCDGRHEFGGVGTDGVLTGCVSSTD